MPSEAVNVKISDAALIQQCVDGDQAAFEKLIIKYKDRIYNVIFRICQNKDDAAELSQDTFVKLITNIGRFEGRSSLYTWIFRIAVNLTLNYCRRQKRTGAGSLDVETVAGDGEAKKALKAYLADDSARDPAVVVQSAEQVELILKAIRELDEEQRVIIVLRDIENMRYSHIAKVLGIELGTVKSRLSRARAGLRLKLGEISE